MSISGDIPITSHLISPVKGQGHCKPSNVSHLPQYKTVCSYNSTLVQARKLMLGMYVNLILTYKTYEYLTLITS